jgi:hypothetical protein
MEPVKYIDFSYPYMQAKKAIGDMHDAMIERDYEKALEGAIQAMTEMKLAYNAIMHEKEQQRA